MKAMVLITLACSTSTGTTFREPEKDWGGRSTLDAHVDKRFLIAAELDWEEYRLLMIP